MSKITFIDTVYFSRRKNLLHQASKKYRQYGEDLLHDCYIALKDKERKGQIRPNSEDHARYMYSKEIWKRNVEKRNHKTKWYDCEPAEVKDDRLVNLLNSMTFKEAYNILDDRISSFVVYDNHKRRDMNKTKLHRKIVRMYFSGYSQAEIADVVDKTEVSVKNIIYRVKKEIAFDEIKSMVLDE